VAESGGLVIWDDEIVELGDVEVIDFTYLRGNRSDYDAEDLRAIRTKLAAFEGTEEYLAALDEWIAEAEKEES
jgi:hypothetical protein